ncbi:hypothetical protein [uncultured Bifidobacterium sp.]|uniref:hypothetical protein n=1 Tax=uncultured Bifidobacterium sp. TaxID=165187 RepID=UPI00258385D3|nr:hypothetical protein [uncultured Bifidobacterium sp.]
MQSHDRTGDRPVDDRGGDGPGIGAMVPARSDTDAGLATSDSQVSANRCAEDIVAWYVV